MWSGQESRQGRPAGQVHSEPGGSTSCYTTGICATRNPTPASVRPQGDGHEFTAGIELPFGSIRDVSTDRPTGPRRLAPYGSAKDLPSYKEMSQLIQGGKLLTRFIARDQRAKFLQVERDMDRLTKVVDDFYDRLGRRNWIFHDRLSVDKVEAILAETSDEEAAEQRLIELYRDTESMKRWVMGLRAQRGLRERLHQIERAREHYEGDLFDSCVLHLIAVMDGFVNDFEPGARKGLAAREPDDMTAWDSVVGHHLGLTHTMKTFRKTIKRRVDEEVFEVYRHGIMHGSIVTFNNVIVATKAWNMLFAVSDWTTAARKAAAPAEPKQSWGDTWSALKRQAAHKRYEKDFISSTVTTSDPGFERSEVVCRAIEFFDAWQRRRWGLVAAFTPPMLLASKSDGEAARFAKDVFGQHELTSWDIAAVKYDQPSTAEVCAAGTVNGKITEIRFRMALWTEAGNVALPTDDGAAWRLAVWAPHTFFDGPA